MKIMGNEVLWESENKNVAVAYSMFDMGCKYKVYRKYETINGDFWRIEISFGTMGEAVQYANKIYDRPIIYTDRRQIPDEDLITVGFGSIPEISPELSDVYKDGVFCKCGTFMLFRNRLPHEQVCVVCSSCGTIIDYG